LGRAMGKYMNEPQFAFLPNDESFLELSQIETLERLLEKTNLATIPDAIFQKGGTEMGQKYLDSFSKTVISTTITIFQNLY